MRRRLTHRSGRLPSKPGWGFLAAVGALVLVLACTLFAFTRLRSASQWVTHTDEVRLGITRLGTLLIDAETSERGYLVSNDPSFLTRYERAKAGWPAAFAAVQRLTADDPRQQSRLAVVHEQIGRRFDEMADTLSARAQGYPTSRLGSRLLEGERQSEALRGTIAQILGEEENFDRERQRETLLRARFLLGLLLAEGLGLMALGASGFVHRRDEVRRLELLDRIEDDQERLRFMTDTLPQLIWTARPDGWVEYFNRCWFEYTGMTPEQSLGWGWRVSLHPDDVDPSLGAWTKSVATGDPYQAEWRLRRADGAYRWHIARAFPQRSSDGTIRAGSERVPTSTTPNATRNWPKRLRA